MPELRIDPEFRDAIPPLTAAEFKQLEENIVSDGEVRSPIITWNGTIIDGHHRWQVIQKHPEIPYKVKEMQFPDKWAALVFMYSEQLGHRNCTDEQKTYLIGKKYEARKMLSAFHGNQYVGGAQNEHDQSSGKRTSEIIAKEHGIGKESVKRAEHFAHGLDAAEKVSPGFREAVLTGEIKAPKCKIAEIAKMDEQEKEETIISIKNGDKPKPVSRKEISQSKQETQDIIYAMKHGIVSDEFSTPDAKASQLRLDISNCVNTLNISVGEVPFAELSTTAKEEVREAVNRLNGIVLKITSNLGGINK